MLKRAFFNYNLKLQYRYEIIYSDFEAVTYERSDSSILSLVNIILQTIMLVRYSL